MRIFTKEELDERNEILSKLSFEVSNDPGDGFDGFDEDEDIKLFVTFFNDDGCVYDGGDITYFFKRDFPEGMYEEVEGLFSYNGDLTKEELSDIISKIGFRNN